MFAAIKDATAAFPFPVLGIDSDNGSEFINWELLTWCEQGRYNYTGVVLPGLVRQARAQSKTGLSVRLRLISKK